MNKLNEAQKNKVKKFIKNLQEATPPGLLQFSKPFKNKREAMLAIQDVLDNSLSEDDFISRLMGARNIGNIEVKDFKLLLGELASQAKSLGFKLSSNIQRIIDKNAIKTNGTFNESKLLKENNTYTMLSALREVVDDLMLQTELLIDENYGKLEHKEFKNSWYKITNSFEKKFNNIQKNLISATKQRGV